MKAVHTIDNEEDLQNAVFAILDADRKNKEHMENYSQAQISQAADFHSLAQSAWFRSRVYLNFREKFYTVKVAKPTRADRISDAVRKLEERLESQGAQKVVSGTGVIYRFARKV